MYGRYPGAGVLRRDVSGIDWYGIVVAYIGLPIFIALYVVNKVVKKTKIVPYEKMDISNKGI